MTEPRKKIDFLYHEVLGEVTAITKRVEELDNHLAKTAKMLVVSIQDAEHITKTLEKLPKDVSDDVQRAMLNTGQKLNTELLTQFQKTHTETKIVLNELSINTAGYAKIALYAAQKMAMLAIVAGAASGLGAALLTLYFNS
ncbi:hypothetical protein JHL22_15100 [Advenella sp. WQ 585]|uniref:StbC n=1 Tax=Advenella mandrilli TaxID=2800330 RepID=A0ABS1EHN3_9BURK|nr:hypothetical protein [Advenella mandrilli]MBK1782538.1 hypothetical protein [Advenella mandrilli]